MIVSVSQGLHPLQGFVKLKDKVYVGHITTTASVFCFWDEWSCAFPNHENLSFLHFCKKITVELPF